MPQLRRKATGRPDQQTEEVEHMTGTIEGSTDLVDEWPVGAELALTNVGCAAGKADRELDAGIARLQAIDTHLCPED